jgi:hypothetical protein
MAKPNAGKAADEAAAKKTAEEAAASNAVKVPALRVTSKREGFRRGGRVWGKEATVVLLSDLSALQIEQIKGEAMLEVAEIEVDAAE